MYQRPDFVKVNLDVKDNFAAYTTCYRKNWTVLSNYETGGTNTGCTSDTIMQYGSAEDDFQCYINDMGH